MESDGRRRWSIELQPVMERILKRGKDKANGAEFIIKDRSKELSKLKKKRKIKRKESENRYPTPGKVNKQTTSTTYSFLTLFFNSKK